VELPTLNAAFFEEKRTEGEAMRDYSEHQEYIFAAGRQRGLLLIIIAELQNTYSKAIR
jgi:hypothetical protein